MGIIYGQKCIIYNKDNQKILVLKRSDYKPFSGVGEWDFVGGKINFRETNLEAIKREAIEEAGIIINNPVEIHSYIVPAQKSGFIFDCKILFCDDFSCKENQIKLSNEHSEYKWVNLDEFENLILRNSVEHAKKQIIEHLKEQNLLIN